MGWEIDMLRTLLLPLKLPREVWEEARLCAFGLVKPVMEIGIGLPDRAPERGGDVVFVLNGDTVVCRDGDVGSAHAGGDFGGVRSPRRC